jgi:hypothetical protein
VKQLNHFLGNEKDLLKLLERTQTSMTSCKSRFSLAVAHGKQTRKKKKRLQECLPYSYFSLPEFDSKAAKCEGSQQKQRNEAQHNHFTGKHTAWLSSGDLVRC